MSNINYLSTNDFSKQGSHMQINMDGLSFVMFHSQRCPHCINFLPEFKNLPNVQRGVNFGICNIDEGNRRVVDLSSNSTTPIKAVPKFLFYIDGVPYVEYNGQRNIQAVVNFLQEIISKTDQKQQFARTRRTRQQEMMPQQAGMHQSPPPEQPKFQLSETGVKIYETSYGRPYNTSNESDFLAYEDAYKQLMQRK